MHQALSLYSLFIRVPVATLFVLDKMVNWDALVNIVKDLDSGQNGKGGRPRIALETKPKMHFCNAL